MTSLREQNEDLRRTLLAWLGRADELLEQRDRAQALARHAVARWRLLQALGHPPGCGPDQRELEQIREEHPWLEEAAARGGG